LVDITICLQFIARDRSDASVPRKDSAHVLLKEEKSFKLFVCDWFHVQNTSVARHDHELSIRDPFGWLNSNNWVLDIQASGTINILLSSDNIKSKIAILTYRKERLMLKFLNFSLTKWPCSNAVRINLWTKSLFKSYDIWIIQFLVC